MSTKDKLLEKLNEIQDLLNAKNDKLQYTIDNYASTFSQFPVRNIWFCRRCYSIVHNKSEIYDCENCGEEDSTCNFCYDEKDPRCYHCKEDSIINEPIVGVIKECKEIIKDIKLL